MKETWTKTVCINQCWVCEDEGKTRNGLTTEAVSAETVDEFKSLTRDNSNS